MGTLVFQATLGGAVNIIGPNIANTINFTLPSADGTSGQTWTTNGSGVLAFGTLGIAGGGTGQITATAAFNALAPSQSGQSGKYLTTDGTNTSWGTNPLGTVTSVGGTGTVNGITLTGTVTTSGNLTLGGTLSNVSLTSQVTGTLPTANGGTNLTSFTSGGVVYASSSSVLATGSALTFDGTTATTPRLAFGGTTLPSAGTATIFGRSSDNNLYLQSGSGNGINFLDGSQNTMLTLAPTNLVFQISNAEQMRLTSTGLGIGTSSPAFLLDVNGRARATQVLITDGGTPTPPGNTTPTIFSPASGVLALVNGGSESLRILANGNVGIGTSSPTQLLDVTATGATTATIVAQNTTASNGGAGLRAGNPQNLLIMGTDSNSGGLTGTGNSSYFYTTSTTPMLFLPNGSVSVKLNQYGIGVGASTPTSGAGITFPATQSASSNANTLDDYEEGTWTPVVALSSSNPTVTYDVQFGSYTKVGRSVTVTCHLQWSNATGGSGDFRISGLPFNTANTTSQDFGSATFASVNVVSSQDSCIKAVVNSSVLQPNTSYGGSGVGSGAITGGGFKNYKFTLTYFSD
jgi:hypothetical protein